MIMFSVNKAFGWLKWPAGRFSRVLSTDGAEAFFAITARGDYIVSTEEIK